MQSLTQRAIELIGQDKPTDWRLAPEEHAASLGPEAEPLRRILLKPEIGKIIAAYGEADREAARFQNSYKRLARIAAWTGFGAALIGSLVLMLVFVMPPRVLTAAMATQAVLLLVSLGTSLIIGIYQPFESWMLKRAEAENARLGLFDAVMSERQTATGGFPLLPLQLEYLRRYLLDVERVYYKERGEQHAAAARAAWWWRLLAFAVVVLAAAFPAMWAIQGAGWLPSPLADLAGSLPHKSEEAQRIIIGLGTIAASLQGLLASFAVISLDERNAARYRLTAENLEALAGPPLEEARAAAATPATEGEAARKARDQVLSFFALVENQISSEHREWIALRKLAPDLALERLKSVRLPPRA